MHGLDILTNEFVHLSNKATPKWQLNRMTNEANMHLTANRYIFDSMINSLYCQCSQHQFHVNEIENKEKYRHSNFCGSNFIGNSAKIFINRLISV